MATTSPTPIQPHSPPHPTTAHQIDVCLYFIAAHRLKAIDIKFMSAIAARVALIPVIAKADSMTAEETVAFRREIMAECEKHQIPCVVFVWLSGCYSWR